MADLNLPAWAKLREGTPEGKLPVVDVDASGMYAAWLAELGAPTDAAALDDYWLECAFQCGKMELQVAMRRPGLEIRIHDADKKFQQKEPNGAHARAASPGAGPRNTEVLTAREQFKRLRGFVPG